MTKTNLCAEEMLISDEIRLLKKQRTEFIYEPTIALAKIKIDNDPIFSRKFSADTSAVSQIEPVKTNIKYNFKHADQVSFRLTNVSYHLRKKIRGFIEFTENYFTEKGK